jgi:hypothetical protein
LVDAGNTVVIVEHELQIIAESDWILDVAAPAHATRAAHSRGGSTEDVAGAEASRTAPYLALAGGVARSLRRPSPRLDRGTTRAADRRRRRSWDSQEPPRSGFASPASSS